MGDGAAVGGGGPLQECQASAQTHMYAHTHTNTHCINHTFNLSVHSLHTAEAKDMRLTGLGLRVSESADYPASYSR